MMEDFEIIDDDCFQLEGETSLHSKLELGARTFGLRDYQHEASDAVIKDFKSFTRILIALATGTGKTVIFVYLTNLWVSQGKRVLILAHTDRLIEQARDKIHQWGLDTGKEKADEHGSLSDDVVVASVQTLGNQSRLAGWPEDHFDYIIIDEAHHTLAKRYLNIIEHFNTRVLGVTATTDRGDKKSLAKVYERISYDYGILQAVRDGWLVRPLVKTLPLSIDLSGIKNVDTIQGQEEVSHRLEPFIDDLAKAIVHEAGGRKTIIFLPSVDISKQMAAGLRKHGMSSDFVSGYCKDPNAKLDAHKRGDIVGLCNAMLLTEGYDDSSIEIVVCLRLTQVRSLYVQIAGRGTRPHGSIVEALNNAADSTERRKIIAQSCKPNVILLDFLWLDAKHDLCSPASLLSKDPRIQERMKGRDGDLLEVEAEASRDFLESLKKAVSRNKNRKAQLIDPLQLAEELSDFEIVGYQPSTRWEAQPVPAKVAERLAKEGVDPVEIHCMGQAQVIFDRIAEREKRGFCTLRQLNFFRRFEKNWDIDPATWAKGKAKREQQLIRENNWKPPAHWKRRALKRPAVPAPTQSTLL